MSTTAHEIIDKIAKVAHANGMLAGVGGCDLAGWIVSCLAAKPELIERFMTEGPSLLVDGDIDPSKGCLTFHNTKGDITTPQELRMSYQVRDMKKAAVASTRSGSEG